MNKAAPVVESVFTFKDTFFRIEMRESGRRYLVAEFGERVSLGLFYDLLEVRQGCEILFAKLNAKMMKDFPSSGRY
jgi:hypothetical protein